MLCWGPRWQQGSQEGGYYNHHGKKKKKNEGDLDQGGMSVKGERSGKIQDIFGIAEILDL